MPVTFPQIMSPRYGLVVQMNVWENQLIRLSSCCRYFRNLSRRLYAFRPSTKVICYPNKTEGNEIDAITEEQ